MTFDDEVPTILAAEREAGSCRLSGWLREQGTWFGYQAYDIEDAALRERYLGLRAAIESWLFPSPDGTPEVGEIRESAISPPGLGETPEAGEPQGPKEPELPANSGDEPGHPEPPLPLPTDQQVAADALDRLWREMLDREVTLGYATAMERADPKPPEPGLEPEPAAPGPDAEAIARARRVWEWIHLVCLRLPAAAAAELRAEAQQAVARVTGSRGTDTGVRPPVEQLIPSLLVVGYPGVDIGYEPDGARDGESGQAEVAHLLRIASEMQWLADHDPAAMVGFGIANSSTVLLPFSKNDLGIYRNFLDDKLRTPPEPSALSLARLDELIRGVVPVPLPAADSWWRSRVKESEQALARLVGDQVRMPQFGTPYKSLLAQDMVGGKPPDITVRPVDAPGTASGHVAWVLLAQVGDGKGRVVYVSSE
jgi:hypothetical protein